MQIAMGRAASFLEYCLEHWQQFLKGYPWQYLERSSPGRVLLNALTYAPFFILALCINILFVSVAAFPATWLWNYFTPALFGFKNLSYWEICVLLNVGAVLPTFQLTLNR